VKPAPWSLAEPPDGFFDDPFPFYRRLRDFDSQAFAIAGAGHNAMVDAPGAVWDWLQASP
jgi:pimeloyl-ACP methyl ester carboxylesterase